jgi:hypothetical protein
MGLSALMLPLTDLEGEQKLCSQVNLKKLDILNSISDLEA